MCIDVLGAIERVCVRLFTVCSSRRISIYDDMVFRTYQYRPVQTRYRSAMGIRATGMVRPREALERMLLKEDERITKTNQTTRITR